MRQETNKEIDLLLRRLSRRDGEAAREAETQMDEHHLDADELSSYAQNVLPPAARARYTEHLADCSTCRRMATELSLALGVTTAAAPVETVSAASGLKKFLSSLFSPMVLRYAVPALGVIVVMIVGFVVLRQPQMDESFIARKTEPVNTAIPQPPAAAAARPATDAAAATDQQPASQGRLKDATGPGESQAESRAKSTAAAGAADSAGAAPAGAAPVAVATPSEVQPLVNQRTVDSLPVQSPLPHAFEVAETKKDSDEKRDSAAKQQPPKVAQAETVAEDKEKRQANEPAPANVRPAGQVAAAEKAEQNKARSDTGSVRSLSGGVASGARRRADESRDDAETRSVAGRTFRKERGIWTDTAYDSSTRTVNMARSSEQFRALVADEPAIKTIAEQLDGEVIVVWKGRAYRIR